MSPDSESLDTDSRRLQLGAEDQESGPEQQNELLSSRHYLIGKICTALQSDFEAKGNTLYCYLYSVLSLVVKVHRCMIVDILEHGRTRKFSTRIHIRMHTIRRS